MEKIVQGEIFLPWEGFLGEVPIPGAGDEEAAHPLGLGIMGRHVPAAVAVIEPVGLHPAQAGAWIAQAPVLHGHLALFPDGLLQQGNRLHVQVDQRGVFYVQQLGRILQLLFLVLVQHLGDLLEGPLHGLLEGMPGNGDGGGCHPQGDHLVFG